MPRVCMMGGAGSAPSIIAVNSSIPLSLPSCAAFTAGSLQENVRLRWVCVMDSGYPVARVAWLAVCTVLLRFAPGTAWPVLVGAVRDEFVDRPWDPPGRYWPDA